MRRMQIEVAKLPLAKPFAISRGTRTVVTVIRVTLEQDGFIGLRKCTPTPRYAESVASVSAQLAAGAARNRWIAPCGDSMRPGPERLSGSKPAVKSQALW